MGTTIRASRAGSQSSVSRIFFRCTLVIVQPDDNDSVVHFFVSIGIGFLVSALYVFFRDLPFFYELVQLVLWLSSTVFYLAAIVNPHIRPFLELNPLYPIIESLRQIVISGNLPDPIMILRAWLSGLIILGIGLVTFNWLRPKFIDLL